tara:strand:- start:422 stop:1855 length:1434 start_codon:yes stop_codon:yes gene_type:complete
MSGLDRSAGYVNEEFLKVLKGNRANQVYKEMRTNDPVIGAILFAIDMMIRQVEWRIEPYSQQAQHKNDAEFLKQCKDDMSHTWTNFISEVLSFLPYGWSWHEVVYKRRRGQQRLGSPYPSSKFKDGKIGWRKIPLRSQDSLHEWKFDDRGGIRAMVQNPPPAYNFITIPVEKSLLFRTSVFKNNPEGRSVLRNIYRPWYMKKKIEEIEGIGIERDLAGMPIAYVDPKILSASATADEKTLLTQIKKLVVNVRRDAQEGIIFPRAYDSNGHLMYEFDLVSSGGARQLSTDTAIQRYNQQMAMTVLADFIMLGHAQMGSFALSSDKTHLFSAALGAWIDIIEDVLNRYAVPRLWQVNGWPMEELPKFEHGDIETPNLAEVSNYIAQISGAGLPLFPDNKLEAYLRKVANFPEADEETKAERDKMREQNTEDLVLSRKVRPNEQEPGGSMDNKVKGRSSERAPLAGSARHKPRRGSQPRS